MTIEEASEYLATRWRAFEDLGPVLLQQRHRAAIIGAQSREAGDLERYGQARGMIGEITRQHGEWLRARDRWMSLRRAMGMGAWPIVPLAWASVAFAVAAAAVWLFSRASANETALDLLERGLLTPAQAADLGLDLSRGRFTWVVDVAKWGAIAAGTYLIAGRGR